jgi:hypothetical protein
MKQKKLGKKIMTIYINGSVSPKIRKKKIDFSKDLNNSYFKKYQLMNQILNQKMNLICFDCRKKIPKYISINNAIFLCSNCALIHKKNFPDKISSIIENNLNLLSLNYLNILSVGGNQNLDNFINYVFPGLQNYPPKILYLTQALNYYRDNLKYKVNLGTEPLCPNELTAYKIVSENGLTNIREKNVIYNNDLNNSLDNTYYKNDNDVVNHYFNNFNNTYNTYNSISISNEIPEKDNEKTLNASLSNKEFFNEMKNLFGKRYIKSFKKGYSSNRKLTAIKSFNNLSKTKIKKYSDLNDYKNNPLTYTLNESVNYSFAKTKETNKNSFKNLHLVNLNKSTINYCYTQRYVKPTIKNIKKNYGINMKYIENEKLKKIYNNKKKFNNIIQQRNVLKYFKGQKKTKSFIKSKENINNSINKINSITLNNKNRNHKLNLDYTDNVLLKEKILQKVNKTKNKNLYLNTDFINKSNDIFIPVKNRENKIIQSNITTSYNNYNKKNKLSSTKKNNINITFDGYTKRIPIKVNLKMDFERKKQALKDKTQQEKKEKNLNMNNNLYYSDIFDNNFFYINKNSNVD